MTILICIYGAIFWVVYQIITQSYGVVKESQYKKSLAPNGYETEYRLCVERWNYYTDMYDKYRNELGDVTLAGNQVADEIMREIQTTHPQIYATVDRQAYDSFTLMSQWVMVWARYETAKRGLNPMITGGETPQPLPQGEMWALYAGQTPRGRGWTWWGHVDVVDYVADSYHRKDEASKRELARVS